MRFNEITIEKFLDEKQVAIKVGFYPMGNDFAVLPYLCNFTNDEQQYVMYICWLSRIAGAA